MSYRIDQPLPGRRGSVHAWQVGNHTWLTGDAVASSAGLKQLPKQRDPVVSTDTGGIGMWRCRGQDLMI